MRSWSSCGADRGLLVIRSAGCDIGRVVTHADRDHRGDERSADRSDCLADRACVASGDHRPCAGLQAACQRIVWTLLGCGLRREELCALRLGDVDLAERKLHVRAATSKSVHPRDVTIPVEVVKELDIYLADHRKGDNDADEPAFTDRNGRRLTGIAVRKLFERLKVPTGIRDLCAHMLRHTWATNFHRSSSGSRFDLMVEGGGWTTGRMVDSRRNEENAEQVTPL